MAFNVEAIGQPLDDRLPSDIAADAVAALQAALPEWVPRNASPEVVYLEAVAQAVAEVTSTANATIGAVVEYLLASAYGVPRSPGAAAVGQLTVTFDSTVTLTIPAGTGFLLPDYGMEVLTTADATVTAGTTLAVQVASSSPTSLLNGVSSATVDVLDPIPNALSVAVTGGFTGGSDPEDDATYLTRARNRLARVTNSLVVADHFSAYALENVLVSNASTINAWDGVAIGTAGTNAGHVTVMVYGFGGQVSAGDRTALETAMEAITYTGAQVHVNAATLQTINVTATVKAKPGESTSAVQANVVAALQSWLSPQTWPFGQTVYTSAITSKMASVDGVDYVISLTTPGSDTTLTADKTVTAGTLTISVT